ncbi:MAG: rhodanese-like domain-containing protein [Schleiferiaceae bacterium]|nr:rhodanese-like domain-containing protein [Schleiferiaceae bacterium]
MTINEAINHPAATIVDVRSEDEFASGNVPGSVNIPLHTVPDLVEDFKNMSQPIVLCCLSGGRSGQALIYLQAQGVEGLHNGGGYSEVLIHKM